MLDLSLILIIGAGALAVYVVHALYAAARSPIAGVPGPWHTRVTRLALKYNVLAGRQMYYIHELHRRYGPVVRIAPDEVAVADLAAFGRIHRVGGGFVKGPWYDGGASGVPGAREPGVFAMRDPRAHADRRRLFARPFSKSALRAHWEPEVRRTAEKTVARIRAEARAGGGADVLKWWTLMTTDVVAHLSFGQSFDMVGLGAKTTYVHAIQNALMGAGIRWELPWLYALARWVPARAVQEVVRSDEIVFEHAGKVIQNLRQHGGTRNLFSQIQAQSESQEKGAHLSDLSVRLEATNLIIAGSDTTAATLTYLVWAVLKRPDLQRRLEEEVADLSSKFSDDDLEALPLLNGVIDETLRLYGAAPGSLPRVVPDGGATMAGHFLPAGTVVTTQAYTMHRDGGIFDQPETFDETRFMKQQSPAQKMAFSPFGMGSRVCLGIHLARMELRLATALFFRECRGARLSPETTDEVMEMENRFLIAPKGHFCSVTLSHQNM